MPTSSSGPSSTRVLIIGQGLAGTALAWHLWRRGIPFLIVDADEANTSSKVAAGLITPISGMRLNLGWRVAELIPAARAFYRELEEKLGCRFYHEVPHIRWFREQREVLLWEKRRMEPAYQPWFEQDSQQIDSPIFHNELGGFVQRGCGWLNTNAYLNASRQFFQGQQCWKVGRVDEQNLSVTNQQVSWQDESFSHVVFCQGWQAGKGHWFPDLRFNCARGVITSFRPLLPIPQRHIYNRNGWISPDGESDASWRAGSTYEFDFNRPPEASLPEIREKLQDLLKIDFELSAPRSAVRPIIRQRNAVLGTHPMHRHLAVFNGLGSKGAMKSPLLAEWLVAHLFDHQPLPTEVDVCTNL